MMIEEYQLKQRTHKELKEPNNNTLVRKIVLK